MKMNPIGQILNNCDPQILFLNYLMFLYSIFLIFVLLGKIVIKSKG